MYDPVGYSGVFLSGYRGIKSSLIQDSPTALTEDDSPWHVITNELRSPEDDTLIILHEERFLRQAQTNTRDSCVYRYRLIVNDTLIPITAAESRYAWMNITAKPDERRLITPAGSLIAHSTYRPSSRHDEYTTWRNVRLWLVETGNFVL